MIDISKVERDYVRWYPTQLDPSFTESELERHSQATSLRPGKPKGLYVHIPYCDVKCSFCNYNVLIKDRASADTWQAVDTYLAAVLRQAAQYAKTSWFKSQRIDSLYVGGGTPSFLDAERLFRLIESLRSIFPFEPNAEIAIEANPISLEPAKLAAMKASGTTRLSVGVQSFDDELLTILGRGVTRQENIKAIEMARESGIPTINLDLIYRNPTQSTEQVISSIRHAKGLGANQVSLYPLWVRPKTEFHSLLEKRRLTLPTEEAEFDQLLCAQQEFERLGYRQYNVFDFVDKPENECINTHHQWGDGEWLGIGPGATSYIDGAFFIQKYDTRAYIDSVTSDRDPIDLGLALSEDERRRRTMIFGLRMLPFDVGHFRNTYGASVHDFFGKELRFLVEKGLVVLDGDSVKLTSLGIFHINGIGKLFYSPARRGSLQVLGRRKDGSIIVERDL